MSFIKRIFQSSKPKAAKTKTSALSQRGTEALHTVLRPDLELFFAAKKDMWHPENNPNGKFPLNMAENNLNWEMMRGKISEVASKATMPNWVSGYTDMRGDQEFLSVMCEFLEDHITHVKMNPDHLAALAGATAIIELSAFILCNPGEIAVIPSPSYPVYTQDIFNKAKVERYDLVTHHDIEDILHEHPLNIDHLEKTYKSLKAEGKRFKMLILTTPDNPTGHKYSTEKLQKIANWCLKKEIHLVVNELYSLSLIHTDDDRIAKNYAQNIEYQSFAQTIQIERSDYLHMIYGLSKDFGMSGFRVGLLYSMNEDFMSAFANLGAPHLVSNYTQWTLAEVFKDKTFISDYIQTNQKLLTETYITVVTALKKMKIPHAHSRGSLFVWLDMSEFMTENSAKEEAQLWNSIYLETGILLTPGIGFGHSKKGQFRLVHTFVKNEILKEAMKKLTTFVASQRGQN